MLKRQFDKLLSAGKGRQLLWLAVVIFFSFMTLWAIADLAFDTDTLEWQDVMALYLDPGCFGGPGKHDWFRLLIVAFGVFLFSALLISVFTNIFDNISEAARKGERRYKLRNHTLFLGNSVRLDEMLLSFLDEYPSETAVVMTTSDVEKLRESIAAEVGDKARMNRIIFYYGERDNEAGLRSACAEYSRRIYILGEENEADHDSTNIKCCDILTKIVGTTEDGKDITPCFMTIEEEETVNVLLYDTQKEAKDSRLSVEVVDVNEYEAEQLLVYSDFLPALTADDERRSHILVTGTSRMSSAFARVCAHLSHYPNFKSKGKKTLISFVGTGMKAFMDNLAAIHPWLFAMSHRRYISADGTETVWDNDPIYGDFLDIEWEFVDTYATSSLFGKLMDKWSQDSNSILSIAVCDRDQHDRIRNILYISEKWPGHNSSIWIQGNHEVISKAIRTGMYGDIKCFGGESAPLSDPLFTKRSDKGMRVNHIYASAYGDSGIGITDAWTHLLFAHKYSSILCANAIRMRERCFPGSFRDDEKYEVEHRRWLLSMLMMGYHPYPKALNQQARSNGLFKELKRKFIHLDIIPYDELPEEEKGKDKIIIDNTDYVETGDIALLKI